MKPADLASSEHSWCLAEAGANYLVYSADGKPITLDLRSAKGEFTVRWIDPASGQDDCSGKPVTGGQTVTLQPPGPGPVAVWLTQTAKAR